MYTLYLRSAIDIKPNMKLKATMLDEYNSATNGSSAKSNLTNFIHVIQVFSKYIHKG